MFVGGPSGDTVRTSLRRRQTNRSKSSALTGRVHLGCLDEDGKTDVVRNRRLRKDVGYDTTV